MPASRMAPPPRTAEDRPSHGSALVTAGRRRLATPPVHPPLGLASKAPLCGSGRLAAPHTPCLPPSRSPPACCAWPHGACPAPARRCLLIFLPQHPWLPEHPRQLPEPGVGLRLLWASPTYRAPAAVYLVGLSWGHSSSAWTFLGVLMVHSLFC